MYVKWQTLLHLQYANSAHNCNHYDKTRHSIGVSQTVSSILRDVTYSLPPDPICYPDFSWQKHKAQNSCRYPGNGPVILFVEHPFWIACTCECHLLDLIQFRSCSPDTIRWVWTYKLYEGKCILQPLLYVNALLNHPDTTRAILLTLTTNYMKLDYYIQV